MTKLHILFADHHIVVATPNEGAVRYCEQALKLEARHEIRTESVDWANEFSQVTYAVIPPLTPEEIGGPHDPLPPDPIIDKTFRTPVTAQLTESVNLMREIIQTRILQPFETTDG